MAEDLDRVRAHTAERANAELDEQRLRDVAGLVGASDAQIARRIEELDREWDVERVLEANASALMLLSLGLAAVHSRRWLALSTAVPAFLLQHALQGWCPPIAVIRRMGVRTRREIDAERTALKAIRGDFDVPSGPPGEPEAVARQALAAAGRRG
jgi:hypothetical protein